MCGLTALIYVGLQHSKTKLSGSWLIARLRQKRTRPPKLDLINCYFRQRVLLLQRFHRQLFCLNKRISNSLPQQRVSNRDWNLSPYFHIVLICQGVFNVIAGTSSKTHKTIRVQCVPYINMQRGEKPKQVDFSSFPWASTKNTKQCHCFYLPNNLPELNSSCFIALESCRFWL